MISESVDTLTTDDGITLDARVGAPAAPRGGVVVCHPHPLYGGDMENPVVVRAAEVCREAGHASVRFDFRGVGRSTGTHDGGAAEQRDVEAALGHLAGIVGGARPLALAGYSFGAAVVAGVAPRRADVAAVALIAPPLARLDAGRFEALARYEERLLIVAGSDDEICPAHALKRLGEALPRATVRIIDGANHFFFGKLYPLGQPIAAWAQQIPPAR